MRIVAQILLAFSALAACSSDNPKLDAGGTFGGIKSAIIKPKVEITTANPFAGLTRKQLEEIEGPLLVINLESTGGYAGFVRIATNQDVETYGTRDPLTFSMRNGILVASRGLAGDLMSAEVSGVLSALKSGKSANYQRSYYWLSGDEQTIPSQLDCTLSFVDNAKIEIVEQTHKAKHWRESCNNASLNVTNDYWISLDRSTIWQSRQLISPEIGHINVTRVIK